MAWTATIATASIAIGLLGPLTSELALDDIALVDPRLDANVTEGRACLVELEVGVRAEDVQRDVTLPVELRT